MIQQFFLINKNAHHVIHIMSYVIQYSPSTGIWFVLYCTVKTFLSKKQSRVESGYSQTHSPFIRVGSRSVFFRSGSGPEETRTTLSSLYLNSLR